MGTFIVGLLVFGGAALIGRSLWRQQSAAKNNARCGGGCVNCGGCGCGFAKDQK